MDDLSVMLEADRAEAPRPGARRHSRSFPFEFIAGKDQLLPRVPLVDFVYLFHTFFRRVSPHQGLLSNSSTALSRVLTQPSVRLLIG
jgi:hypothetical protein